MAKPLRIDQAIRPAGLIKSAVAFSLFIADHGVYAISTGNGWRLNVRGRIRNEQMVTNARSVARTLDPGNLPGELDARPGSMFIPAADLVEVELSRRGDTSLDLRFTGGENSHRFQFDLERADEVERFVAGLARLAVQHASAPSGPADRKGAQSSVVIDADPVETVALPSPCWGATPHVAVADGRLYVQYLAPIEAQQAEKMVVYRSTDREQVSFVAGRLDLLVLCQRLVRTAWGITPAAAAPDQFAAPVRARLTRERSTLQGALALSAQLLDDLRREQGRGGSAEQIGRSERILELEHDQTELQRRLDGLAALGD